MPESAAQFRPREIERIIDAWLMAPSNDSADADDKYLALIKWATDKFASDFRDRLNLFTKILFSTAYAGAQTIAQQTPRDEFRDVEAFVIFVGYPATGHSLIGSILDAHPEMLIAHELHVAEWLKSGTARHQLFSMLMWNSKCSARIGRYWNDHSYVVPGQWQGRSSRLRVIGDKKGAPTTLACMKDPQLLKDIADLVGVPLKVIHAIRNPYDEIASRLRRYRLSDGGATDPEEISKAIEWTAKLYHFNDRFLNDASRYCSVFNLKHEDLTKMPWETIRETVEFVGLGCPDDYLEASARIVSESPDPARLKMNWTDEQLNRVAKIISEIDLFRGYTYA